ncbi:hypothetical protein MSG28_009043 [Choristoneura fumiferana]|uniref:Uncharacterized protein n=1 Tax=Choristoneura fumiferana TaxID=7141 RepID=A0ACC0KVY0_CHOFU|nr:hypothetical protein MSG28_009043 [Choristoneura fumiferana]
MTLLRVVRLAPESTSRVADIRLKLCPDSGSVFELTTFNLLIAVPTPRQCNEEDVDDDSDEELMFINLDKRNSTAYDDGSLLDEIRNTIRGFNDSVNPGSEVEDDTEETEFGTTIRQSVGIAASDFPMDLPDYVSSEDRNRILEIERLDDDYLQSVASADKVRFDWHKDPEIFTGVKEDFTASAGPTFPVDETMSPLDIMEKIWDPAIIDLIVEQTNTYARRFQETGIKDQSRMKAWKPIKTEDIWNFFAILILQSLDPRPTETEYWYSSIPYLAMPSFGQAMRAKKYIRIKKCLHFVDNQNMPKGDKLAKIRPIVDHLNDKFATLYIPSQNIALDESLMLWKGRLGFVQKISNKAAGVGIKTYELAETETGYLWTFRVYAGKGDNVEQIEQNEQDKRSDEPDGKVSAIVLDLVKPLLHKGYTLVMDNFYNSPLLSRLLKMQKTDTLGTLRINREFVPESLKHCAKRDMRVGELVYSHTNDLSVILWRDSNMVAMISSYHKVEVGGKEKYGKYKYKPQAVLDYNKSMGGVDKKDQLLSAFPMERIRNHVWYKKLFRRLFNVSILNAWIILKTAAPKLSHRNFRAKLVENIMVKYVNGKMPIVHNLRSSGVRPLLIGGHYCVKSDSGKARARCKWCASQGRDSRTIRICNVCRVALCAEPCFQNYHTQP